MVKQVVEQLRQLILTHNSSQQLENVWNSNGLKGISKEEEEGKYDFVFIKLCLTFSANPESFDYK